VFAFLSYCLFKTRTPVIRIETIKFPKETQGKTVENKRNWQTNQSHTKEQNKAKKTANTKRKRMENNNSNKYNII